LAQKEKKMDKLNLDQTINDMLNALFSEEENISEVEASEETVEKAVNSESSTPADADKLKVEEAEKVETDREDFPEQINSFDEKTGKIKDKEYKKIAPKKEAEKTEEAEQVSAVSMKKSYEISEEEYALFTELKAAKENEAKEAEMKKAHEEKADLVKSIIESAVAEFRKENEELKKSLEATQATIAKMAAQPKEPKCIVDVLEPVEKSQAEVTSRETLSKAEMQEVANELAINKSVPEFEIEHATQVERCLFGKDGISGLSYLDPNARRAFETALKRKK
jgi:chemotaxis protein histidine kinase CheA